MLPDDWRAVLDPALDASRWSQLAAFVDSERRAGPVYPADRDVFRAFELTPYADVRVVILGQDPYHGEGQAHGLAFSVAQGKLTPSLRTIRKELERDPEVAPPEGGNLEGWARQGVLLLNTVLTVRASAPNSHREKGWGGLHQGRHPRREREVGPRRVPPLGRCCAEGGGVRHQQLAHGHLHGAPGRSGPCAQPARGFGVLLRC